MLNLLQVHQGLLKNMNSVIESFIKNKEQRVEMIFFSRRKKRLQNFL